MRAANRGICPPIFLYALNTLKDRFMDVIDTKDQDELLRSLLAEVAKANNELNCATTDLKKAKNRLSFIIMLTNKLIDRQGD